MYTHNIFSVVIVIMIDVPRRPGKRSQAAGLDAAAVDALERLLLAVHQDSSKGGAVETGCSDLYGVIY